MYLKGEELPSSKLTNNDVRLIRELLEYREALKKEIKTIRNQDIADKFNVHIRTIDRISTGESWSHL